MKRLFLLTLALLSATNYTHFIQASTSSRSMQRTLGGLGLAMLGSGIAFYGGLQLYRLEHDKKRLEAIKCIVTTDTKDAKTPAAKLAAVPAAKLAAVKKEVRKLSVFNCCSNARKNFRGHAEEIIKEENKAIANGLRDDSINPIGMPIYKGTSHLSSAERAFDFGDTYHVVRRHVDKPTKKSAIASMATVSVLGLGGIALGLRLIFPAKK